MEGNIDFLLVRTNSFVFCDAQCISRPLINFAMERRKVLAAEFIVIEDYKSLFLSVVIIVEYLYELFILAAIYITTMQSINKN
jgi:hypothetical protein